ncbi:hypothetical protein MNV49_001709 [Pseudohyphozyma bogoriensis]|nr:hypothetical protein MNV49_001709 [Pseudohyphozyma bogoriensis]
MGPPSEVDVIIVGGGAAGSVVAGRLAKADPNLQVAIIESGQDNRDMPSSIQPALYISHLAPTSTTGKEGSVPPDCAETNVDSSFYVGKESKALGGRAPIVPTGHVMGGGSSINFMMYTRGSQSDYDGWEQEGWTYEDILPLAKKMETCHLAEDQDPELHGTNGPLQVSYGGHQSEIGRQFVKATQDCYDVPFQHDIQDFKTGHGLTNWAKWICPKTGKRQDAANAFVHPTAASQTNLHVITQQRTTRVLFDGDRATGVEYCFNPLATKPVDIDNPPKVEQVSVMKARKMVVVAAGALGTPQVLERSGVGSKEVLQKAGVDVVVDLPGVGAEYQDHQLALATYCVDPEEDTLDDYLRGNPDAGMKARPTEKEVAEMGSDFQKVWEEDFKNAPDRPVMFGGVVSTFLGDHSLLPLGKYIMMGAYLMYPYSRGSIHITSKDPFSAPDFDPGFLSHPADMEPQVWMYKRLREIARRMPTYRGEIAAIQPKFAATSSARSQEYDSTKVGPGGLGVAAGVENLHISDDKPSVEDLVYSEEDNEAVREWLRANVGTTWHSMSTCPMKAREDGGVVDARLNVYGTKNLKLADLSICPKNMGSNTYSVALTVGEKAAVLIGEDLGISGV